MVHMAEKAGHSLQPSFGTMYENPAAYKVGEAPESIYTDDVLKSADDTVALVVISRDSSEASDYNPEHDKRRRSRQLRASVGTFR